MNVAKNRHDSGLEYISVKKKVAVPSCITKCYDCVGVVNVKNIFEEHWKMASHNTLSSYIAKHTLPKEVTRRYITYK